MRLAGALAIVASLLGSDGPSQSCEPDHFVPGRLLVKFEEGTTPQAVARSLARVGARAVDKVPGLGVDVVAVERRREALAARLLGADPAVDRVERDVVVSIHATTPNDTFWMAQAGAQDISAPGAWDLTRGS